MDVFFKKYFWVVHVLTIGISASFAGRAGSHLLEGAFLAGDDARYLTGNTLFVDGGAHINGAPWNPELPD